MANEFKVKNGIKFQDGTVQTTAGLPLTGGALTGGLTTAGTIGINYVVGSTPGLDVNHSGTQVYALRVGDQTTITNNTGIYLRTTSTATVAWGAGGKLVLATSGGSVARYTIGSAGQLGIGASESFGTAGQVLTSGGPSAAPSWTTVSGGGGSSITNTVVTDTTQTASINTRYILTAATTTTLTLPATPAQGDTVYILVANNLTTNVIARNSQNIMGLAEDLTIDNSVASFGLIYIDSTLGWRFL